jgi:hypothetical protein
VAPGFSRHRYPADLHAEVKDLAGQRMIEIEHDALVAISFTRTRRSPPAP